MPGRICSFGSLIFQPRSSSNSRSCQKHPPAWAKTRAERWKRSTKCAANLGFAVGRRYGAAHSTGAARGRRQAMADKIVPHFHNDPGVAAIEIGAKEFMCIGATPPFDHPHVFIDMGDAAEIICPYCSTLFRYDSSLGPRAARPAECALADEVTG